ncbi:AAA family ATPase [Methylomonas sp. OY6]|uniref:AAA family ATPase n=1 Tax=Methylomonas defluvii TaxID=3045149 RepID=A0ABU4UH26_9GAMM|nr:AAA family ATPase [Methylomonas sp. OY6]MDX8128024.1 AAA family ATPase [Methylomonas sp. OY6]
MSILIKKVRIAGFRGLKNIEVELEQTTVITGMNNSGKTSFLKALQLALGNRLFLSQDDFYIQDNQISPKIIIDLLFVPVKENKKASDFSEDWELLFTTNRIRNDDSGNSFVASRTTITFDSVKNSYKTQKSILQTWPDFESADKKNWFDSDDGKEMSFGFEEIPFFYMDAQRDILEDIKLKSSYIGKMLAKIEYSEDAIKDIEAQIKALNETAVNSSDILTTIKNTLKELDTAMDSHSEGIDITPFTKKLRDLSKGLSIYYSDQKDSFPMEYHGMGTRSWSSLLTLKSFITLLNNNAAGESPFFPILAIEEPEAHLHPNAQKKLYEQINNIPGQKIISTHSPYIAAASDLKQIRNFYKDDTVHCGKIKTELLTSEEIRKINRQVINTRGEIFFSKLLVFFEGETEEQALPIFAHHYFGKSPVEMGIDFVGVGGFKSYLPFLRFSEELSIPWLILSDAEPDAITWVEKHIKNSATPKSIDEVVIFLDNGNDFEKQIISDGFHEEIKRAILSLKTYENEHHERAQKHKDEAEVNLFDAQKLYEILTGDKTQFGPLIAEKIVNSGKNLPIKIVDLFKKIEKTLTSGDST